MDDSESAVKSALVEFRRTVALIPAAQRKSLSWRSLSDQLHKVYSALEELKEKRTEWKNALTGIDALLESTRKKIDSENQTQEKYRQDLPMLVDLYKLSLNSGETSGTLDNQPGSSEADALENTNSERKPPPKSARDSDAERLRGEATNPTSQTVVEPLLESLIELRPMLEGAEAKQGMLEERVEELRCLRESLTRQIEAKKVEYHDLNSILDKEIQMSHDIRKKEDKWKQEVAQRLAHIGEQVRKLRDTKLELLKEEKDTESRNASELKENQTVIAMRDALSRRITYGQVAKKALNEQEMQLDLLRMQLQQLEKFLSQIKPRAQNAQVKSYSFVEVVHNYESRLVDKLRTRIGLKEQLNDLRSYKETLALEKKQLIESIEFLKQISLHQKSDALLREESLRTSFRSVLERNLTAREDLEKLTRREHSTV